MPGLSRHFCLADNASNDEVSDTTGVDRNLSAYSKRKAPRLRGLHIIQCRYLICSLLYRLLRQHQLRCGLHWDLVLHYYLPPVRQYYPVHRPGYRFW